MEHDYSGPDNKKRKVEPSEDSSTESETEQIDLTSLHNADAPTRYLPSPIQLTRIRDLPAAQNVDTVSLHDILGDPLIKEVWNFNYLHNIDYVLSHLDPDVRELVQLKVIHGSWKREDSHRVALEEAAKVHDNVQLITAYMPDMYGEHTSLNLPRYLLDNRADE